MQQVVQKEFVREKKDEKKKDNSFQELDSEAAVLQGAN